MELKLRIALIIFALVWLISIWNLVKNEKISVKYSIIWFISACAILVVGAIPNVFEWIAKLIGFITLSNLIVALLLTLLLIITLRLTIIVTEQRKKIKDLVQEISIIKKDLK